MSAVRVVAALVLLAVIAVFVGLDELDRAEVDHG